MLLETTYVGSVSHHLIRQPNINFPDLASVGANPKNSTNFYNPYKGFTSIAQYRSDSNANYNSLQVYLSKRTGRVTYTIGYTFAKGLGDSQSNGSTLENWRDLSYNYGELNIDRKHAFVSTVVWQLPTFRTETCCCARPSAAFRSPASSVSRAAPTGPSRAAPQPAIVVRITLAATSMPRTIASPSPAIRHNGSIRRPSKRRLPVPLDRLESAALSCLACSRAT